MRPSNRALFAGPHPGGPGQVEPNRRRDLGEGHSPGEEQEGGEGVRQGSGAHRQRLGRRIRRVPVSQKCFGNK